MLANPLANSQRPLLSAAALPLFFLALATLLFAQDLLVINDLWLNNHSHDLGYPTLALCLFFSYRSWASQPGWRWIPPLWLLLAGLLGAVLLYLVAESAILQGPRLLGFVLIAVFFIAVNVPAAQRLGQLLSFSLLLYTIPIWGVFTNLLQWLTVQATSFGLDLLQIPAVIHGYYISLPGGTLEVEEGCSGLRYLVTTLLICHLFCLLNKPALKGWILLFASGIGLALLANWLRVFILSYVAWKTDLQHPWIHDHEALGWAVYSFIYIPLYFLGGCIMPSNQTARQFSFLDDGGQSQRKASLLMLLLATIVITAPYAAITWKASQPLAEAALKPAESLGLCYLNRSGQAQFTPRYNGASQQFAAVYDCTEGTLETHYLHYARQSQGKELINVFNSLLDQEQWYQLRSGKAAVADAMLAVYANKQGEQLVTIHSYLMHGQFTTAARQIRTLMIQYGMLDNLPAGLVVATMKCKTDCRSEEVFIGNVFASYRQTLPGVQSSR